MEFELHLKRNQTGIWTKYIYSYSRKNRKKNIVPVIEYSNPTDIKRHVNDTQIFARMIRVDSPPVFGYNIVSSHVELADFNASTDLHIQYFLHISNWLRLIQNRPRRAIKEHFKWKANDVWSMHAIKNELFSVRLILALDLDSRAFFEVYLDSQKTNAIETPSTLCRINLNPQLYLSGYAFCPH